MSSHNSTVPPSNCPAEMYPYEYFLQSDVCRLCWSRGATIELFPKTSLKPWESNKKLGDIIRDCLAIDLSNETHPKNVCHSCANYIENFYSFKSFCLEQDRKLKGIFEKHNSAGGSHIGDIVVKIEVEEDNNASADSLGRWKTEPNPRQIHLVIENAESHPLKPIQQLKELVCNICGSDVENSEQLSAHYQNDHGIQHDSDSFGPKAQNVKLERDGVSTHVKIERHRHTVTSANKSRDKMTFKAEFTGDRNSGDNRIEEKYSGDSSLTSDKTTEQVTIEVEPLNLTPGACSICETTFENVDELPKHYMSVHGIQYVPILQSKTNPYPVRQIFSENTQPKPDPVCNICMASFESVDKLTTHYFDYHRIKYKPRCQKKITPYVPTQQDKISDKKVLKKPVLKKDGTKLACNICRATVKHIKELSIHYSSAHGIYDNEPLVGSKKGSTKELMEYCTICLKAFQNIKQMAAHNLKVHNIKDEELVYKCFGCGKGFLQSRYRRVHEKNCKDLEHGYECAICKRFLQSRRQFDNHYVRLHENNESGKVPKKPFQCPTCDEVLESKLDLKIHKKTHIPKKEFICETCGGVFKKMAYLRVHNVIHTGVKHYQCSECPYKTALKHSLLIHTRKHTGERPYACDMCPQRCMTVSNLAAHKKRHLGLAERFPCAICPKDFGTKSDLRNHVETTHDGSVSYSCHHCSMIYNRKKSLRRHLRAKHAQEDGNATSSTQ